MAINARAKGHYDDSCEWLRQAVESESVNDAIKFTGFAEVAIKLAVFAVENHALVAGIDTGTELSHPTQSPPTSGPQPWGGPPKT